MMEGAIYFPRTCDKNDEPRLYLRDAERIP
nr:MAG TPA: hypothetical protein [Caudoviricetes sp.]